MSAFLAPFWKYISGGLLAVTLVFFLLWKMEARHAHKWEQQAVNYKRQLDAISSKRNEQKATSERTVEKVVEGQRVVQKVVQVIHDAPNPPDCKTPALDQLRNAV